MSYSKQTIYILSATVFFSLFLSILIYLSISKIYSFTAIVDTSVRISVCGDGVVEFPENCEPSLNETFSCTILGFDGGDMGCDPSCEYDLLNCFDNPPTVQEVEEVIDNNPIIRNNTPIITQSEVVTIIKVLRIFDNDGDGIVRAEEFFQAVFKWVSVWRDIALSTEQKEVDVDACDMNDDGVCNLIDFSILLYYSRDND